MPKQFPRLDPEHVNALKEWIADCKSDLKAQKHDDYLKGQLSGFELCWDLIHGKILESDDLAPF